MNVETPKRTVPCPAKEHVHHDAINGFWVGVCDGKIPKVHDLFVGAVEKMHLLQ